MSTTVVHEHVVIIMCWYE